ncbi:MULTISPECIES: DHA2 family efflux MFS transporter permease subunit [Streptomyces]|uniref:DHA2 family efflux MFS transporter permease subunit n=1 Tax=Streptomyces TaxID=1883 RepID=UPI000BC76D26|nr:MULTISPECIES: DHA2 family efflux MFS transporter permease subunit [Streptomyces]MDX2549644.1 DHA2 family efflux MFS transporter permease subunit [Streptomyces stelliscabiei]MDX2616074.1 DHA2 family efflux MFS transporter permease subunit [Streptomyces stelliscabiei]MDX2634238.1 DHA2 family efflux MFS transporter permease subunit [Streptomyces stelliscabiei]MDX2664551.1 DHA2 family efflux MFS transporter permease subunit [Streptomyces stelliscabiei]MDX2713886.1 DHA2 family efflux MFS transpo
METVITPPQARPDPRRWWALGALVASMLVLGFDMTILNVALPTMAGQLGASTGEQQWMADAYIVVFAALMLPAGLLGDRFGRRRMLITGLGIFLAGSVVGALAQDVDAVVVARAVMGIGAALVTPLALSVLPSLFAPDERTKAVGIVSAGSTLGLPLGPIIGGWLLDHYWWGSVFLINLPMAAIGMAACVFLLPETRDPASPRVDTLSTALTAAGLGSLVYAIIEAPTRGWTDPLVLGMFAASAVLITALVLRERRAIRPMLDMGLLAHRGFLFNALAATLVMFVLSGLMFVLPPYLQAVLGNDALGTGVRLLPLMGGLLVGARVAQPVVERFGSRSVVGAGLVVLAFAALLGSRTTVGSGYGFTALWLSLAGAGFGLSIVPAMSGALGTLPADRAGSGSGLLMTLRQVGGAIGIALLGSLLAGVFRDRLDTAGLPSSAADTAGDSVVAAHVVAERAGAADLLTSANSSYVHGMGLVLLVCGATALVAALLAVALLPSAPTAKDGGSTGGEDTGPDLATSRADARQ